jgi:hypothetical protein
VLKRAVWPKAMTERASVSERRAIVRFIEFSLMLNV